jgi:hypothetical protein
MNGFNGDYSVGISNMIARLEFRKRISHQKEFRKGYRIED